ncbi:MAG: hypothetical protein EHM42_13395 [Planctomycetaceae bacterium]|nr:MAG: hypothetical protein EHM42_13395 [Planctomycetaceae bacterium]
MAGLRALYSSAVRFMVASVASFLVAYGITIGLHELADVSEGDAFGAALVVVFFLNFLSYRFFIYGRSTAPLLRQFGVYACSAAAFRGLEYVVFNWLMVQLQLDYRLVTPAVLLGSTLGKFLFYRFVFGDPSKRRLREIDPRSAVSLEPAGAQCVLPVASSGNVID